MVSSSFRGAPRVKLLCALVASCFAAEGLANPTGPAVAAGAASFNTVGKTLTVTNTPNAIINWKGFSIGAREVTRFQQQGASSAVLNRVVGQDPSAILGTLSSNGKVFLVNPNGVLFGQGSRIDVAGFVASTLNITDPDFLAGRLNFQAGAIAGSIVNQGEIVSASGGRIYLIAPDVQNHGLISSPSGEIVLAAGKTVSLVDADVPNLKVEVQAGGEALNVGKIIAEGGKVGIYAGLINQRGIVRADSVSKDITGKIVFKASDTTILDEGSVTSAAGARGGEIQVLGNKVGLVGNARVDASGDAGGGTVLIGGDFQGKNPEVQNAFRTYVGLQSSITADAITSGDGGKVIVWADDATRAYGTISARGGAQSGNGGFVEVSGKNWLDFQANVDTSAPNGLTGVLFLDPMHVEIGSVSNTGAGAFDLDNPNIFSGGEDTSQIRWDTLQGHLAGTNVFVTTTGNCSVSASCGDIDIISDSPDLATSNMLRLLANRHVNVNGNLTNTGGGALEIYAGWNGGSTSAPVVSMLPGSITLAPSVPSAIFYTGDVTLVATTGISQTANGKITANKLLAYTNSGSVLLDQATNMVSTLAGASNDQFLFKNGQALTIGTVGAVNGITVIAPSSFSDATIDVQTSSGNLNVTNNVTATASEQGGIASIALETAGGDLIATPGVAITATGGFRDSGLSLSPAGSATVSLIASNLVSLNGTTVTATGANDTDSLPGAGGAADILVQAGGTISVSGSSTINALGGNHIAQGGDATVRLASSVGAVGVNDSSISATGGGATGVLGNAGGKATVVLESSGSIGLGDVAGPVSVSATGGFGCVVTVLSCDPTFVPAIVAVVSNNGSILSSANITADGPAGTALVGLTSHSGSIVLSANGTIRDATAGLAGGELKVQNSSFTGLIKLQSAGGVGEPDNPIRIHDDTASVIASNTAPFGDIVLAQVNQDLFLNQYTITNSAVGNRVDISALAGDLTTSGSPLASPNGPLFLRAADPTKSIIVDAALSAPAVSLFGENMSITAPINAGTGPVQLAPYSLTRDIGIQNAEIGGQLSIGPSEMQQVTASTLTIGRSDSTTGILYLNEPITSANVNAATLRLHAAFIFENAGGGIGGPFNHNLEMRAGGGIDLAQNSIILADNNNLSILAGQDFAGNINIGGVTLQVGTTGANTGSMTLQAGNSGLGTQGNINAAVSGGGFGSLLVTGTGNMTIAATGSMVLQNSNASLGSLNIQAAGGLQDVSANSLQLIAGSGSNTNVLLHTGGTQTITVGSGGLSLVGGTGAGSSALAQIANTGASGTQSITVNGGGNVTLTGGSASGSGNFAMINANGGAQSITFSSGGNLLLTGGTVGTSNSAQISALNPTLAAQTQTITGATGITLTGGASGGGLDGSNNSLGNFARIMNSNGSQNISAGAGGITLTGGGGSLTSNFAFIQQGSSAGSPGTSQIVTINNGGVIALQGGSSAQSNVINNPGNLFRGSYAMIQANGDSQLISFTSGGALNLTGGTVGSNNAAQILSRFGLQTISGAPAITIEAGDSGGFVDIATNKNEGNFAQIVGNAGQNITAGAITLTGGDAGVGNHAQIFAGSTTAAQTITAANISLTGGAGGGIDSGSTGSSMSNYALIQSNAAQTINAVDVSLQAGAGGTENFAAITAPTQAISVSNDLSLVGGGSATGTVRGGGARIGGGGGSNPAPTNLTLLVGGDLTMTGGSVAGTAIGSGIVGGQTTSIDIDVGGNVTLNPGTVASSESRIGSPASGMAGGDISITAGGTVALNSNPGLGTFIRTLGNVSINAASITQGADSGISAAGTLTTVSSGSQTLNGMNTVASLDATTGGGSLHFTNSTTLDVLNGATSGGVVDITVNSGDLNIPGAINAGSGGVTLAAPAGTVNGTGTSPDITGGTLDITAGNIIGSGGLHLSVPQINSLVATAGQIDVSNFTTATLLNVQASGSIALNSTAPLTIAGPVVSASGQVTINSPATSFAGNVSLTNYTFGSSTTLQSGTLNLAGTTTIPLGTTVMVQGGTLNASSGTVNVAGTMQTTSGSVSASTVNLNGLFDASGGAVTVGTFNVLSGGTLSGTGTIVGNVNNSAGIVSPGASPGILTITGNYTQGASGVLDMQIGGLVAGSDYDQLQVGGTTSLAGTLNTALINGFVPVSGDAFTLIQSSGPISGTFTTVNSPVGSLFNSFYGPTTFEFVAAASAVLPPPLVVAVNNVIVSTEQLIQPVIEVLEIIPVSAIVSDTTTTAEGQLVPKKTSCQ